ncbi:Hypothetical predicted protein [Mytilus galloprovincialis]|uniref:Uncharacterized protein n=1 Tax=Mytilus galloprovincialis TaxID=29158 RepID=A0A8B6GNP7_MYTGA|nr:Hypothetical predicted protein [Mytilus galloprovincialis]
MTSIIYSEGQNRFGLITSGKRDNTMSEAKGFGKFENSKEIVEHLRKTHSYGSLKDELKECEELATQNEPKEQFDVSELKIKEVQDVSKKARVVSALVFSIVYLTTVPSLPYDCGSFGE